MLRTEYNGHYALYGTRRIDTSASSSRSIDDSVQDYKTKIAQQVINRAEILGHNLTFTPSQQDNKLGTIKAVKDSQEALSIQISLSRHNDVESIELKTERDGYPFNQLNSELQEIFRQVAKIIHSSTDREVSFANFDENSNISRSLTKLSNWQSVVAQALKSPYILVKDGLSNLKFPFSSISKQGDSVEIIGEHHPENTNQSADLKAHLKSIKQWFKAIFTPAPKTTEA